MAAKKIFKRKAGRRYNKPKRGKRSVTVNRALTPIPQRYITQMKYSSSFTTSATSPTWNWNLNSVYDPDRAGVGHQPYGYDQLAALYNRYRVISCSYVITGYSTAGVLTPIQITAVPVNGGIGAGILTVTQAKESPRCKFITQVPGGSLAKLKGSVYLPSLFGRNKAQYMADDHYQSLTSSNPTEMGILSVTAGDLLGNAADAVLTITLQYTVEFFDVIQQVAS